ncbi:multicopper oxidase family protein [Corynebacterium caspium]|uniref:multicopper oxidase family protein n=1 Tax=Corynebacterium caspium TaxID=234828 RepID=UPI000374D2E4|nr:multicopper oxidase domain-containing protein [Corynebacterium caspium]WKD59580.1 Multicopper oxidase mco [Corynebacterium caspium DSM 44850]
MRTTRRTFFKAATFLALGAAASPLLGGCSMIGGSPRQGWDGARRALPIPPLEKGKLISGVRHFELFAGEHTAEILPGVQTKVWGFNGAHLGPVLYMQRGEKIAATVHNELPEMTTIHWHGMKLPAIADGGPHSPIEPGKSWTANWEVEQAAATVWYHPHPHEATALHAYRGLAGAIVIDDEVAASLEIPKEYGVDDIPLVLMDQKFLADGQLDEFSDADLGLMGDVPTVNGITNPEFKATTTRVRFRILDAATMRFFNLRFSDGRSFHVIATDSGFLDTPHEVKELPLGPGERMEIVVDLKPEENLTLEAIPYPDNMGVPKGKNYVDFRLSDSFPLLHIVGPDADAKISEIAALPATLVPIAAPAITPDAVRREFRLNTFSINEQSMDMERVDFTIERDAPEVWVVTNENRDWPHNFHIHNCRFLVIEHDNSAEAVWTTGWKDTVTLPPGTTVKLLVDMAYHPDPNWAYMYHCHMLLHEDEGMMGQFVITRPGEPAALDTPGLHSMKGHKH